MNSPQVPGTPTAAQLQPTVDLQTGSNTQTAAAQAALNNVSQVTPYGNLTYAQTGTSGTGVSQVPTYTATMSLSPQEQALLTQQQAIQGTLGNTSLALANLTNKVQGQAANALAKPLNLSDPAIGAQIAAMYNPRLDTQWTQNYNSLQADLANRGVSMGSQAYNQAMQGFQQGKNDAYNTVMINARDQAVNEMTQQHTQPLSDLSSLLSSATGSQGQVQSPQTTQTPQTGIPATNVIQQSQNQYSNSLNAYNAQLTSQNALLGGLAGLGSSVLGGWAMSDRRLKEDVKKVGKLDDGTNIYSFRYKGHPLQSLGVMAQEIEKKYPEAVKERPDGFKAVNYSRVAERVAV